jgi:hypothetical protein
VIGKVALRDCHALQFDRSVAETNSNSEVAPVGSSGAHATARDASYLGIEPVCFRFLANCCAAAARYRAIVTAARSACCGPTWYA